VSSMVPSQDSGSPESPGAAFERILNTEEAAALLQIHPKTLQRMARQGVVPAFRIGDLWGERQRRAVMVGTREEYPTESSARAAQRRATAAAGAADFGAVISRYEQEEMPERYSTEAAYRSYINNQIRPRWANTRMTAIKPMAVEDWLRNLALAPKTRSHARSLMHTIFQPTERWELIDRNPIKLVRVKGGQAPQNASGPRARTVPLVAAVDSGAVPDNGADRRLFGPASQRDCCA
jgi:excisionase family DNA binding protein